MYRFPASSFPESLSLYINAPPFIRSPPRTYIFLSDTVFYSPTNLQSLCAQTPPSELTLYPWCGITKTIKRNRYTRACMLLYRTPYSSVWNPKRERVRKHASEGESSHQVSTPYSTLARRASSTSLFLAASFSRSLSSSRFASISRVTT